MASWGNELGEQYGQDMESQVGYHLYATENSSTDPAIKGHNNNSSGVAIHSDGRLQVDGQVLVDTGASYITSVSITNGTGAYALDIAGKVRVTKDYAATALQVINPNESPSGFALHASGKVLADYDGDGDAVKISHTVATELALNVDGMARIRKSTASAYSILEVINDGDGGAIHADGKLQVDGDSDFNGALQVDGNSNLNGNLDVSGTLSTNTIVPSSGSLVQVGVVEHGSVNLGHGQWADSIVKTLCPLHCNGFIDTISAVPLRVGQSHDNNASLIELARPGILTRVLGTLQVEQAATLYSAATLNGALDINNTVDLDANTTGVAMDVDNANTDPAAIAIKAEAPVALDARGLVAIASGEVLSLDGVSRQNYITYNAARSRMEFYIGGTMVFVIDSTGGHNP